MSLSLKARYALVILGLTLATVLSLSAALLTGFGVTSVELRETTVESMELALLRQYERRASDLASALGTSIADEISGTSRSLRSRSRCICVACETLVLGMRIACTRMSSSSVVMPGLTWRAA